MTLFSNIISKYRIRKHGFYFIDIPRTSSSSIKATLANHYGNIYGKQNIIEKAHATEQVFPDHLTASTMRHILGKRIWHSIFTFAIVRNPWDRVFSLYKYRIMVGSIPDNWTLSEYVHRLGDAGPQTNYFKYEHLRLGSADYLIDHNGEIIVSFIARFEKRNTDLEKVSKIININNLGALHLQKSTILSSNYHGHYDDDSVEIIGQIYEKDIRLFNYKY